MHRAATEERVTICSSVLLPFKAVPSVGLAALGSTSRFRRMNRMRGVTKFAVAAALLALVCASPVWADQVGSLPLVVADVRGHAARRLLLSCLVVAGRHVMPAAGAVGARGSRAGRAERDRGHVDGQDLSDGCMRR